MVQARHTQLLVTVAQVHMVRAMVHQLQAAMEAVHRHMVEVLMVDMVQPVINKQHCGSLMEVCFSLFGVSFW